MSRPTGTSLSHRLRWTFAALVSLLCVVGLSGACALALTSVRIDLLSRQLTPAVEANTEVRVLLDDGRDVAVAERLEVLRGLVGDRTDLVAPLAEQEDAVAQWAAALADDGTATARLAVALRANQVVDVELRSDREDVRAETRALRSGGLVGLALLTVATAAAGAVIARRAVSSLDGPSDRLRGVLERLRLGEHGARADESGGPLELRAVARAVNHLADESDRLRAARRETARLRRVSLDVSRRVREELEPEDVMRAALEGLAPALGVDRAWVRLVGEAGIGRPVVQWHRPGLSPVAAVPVGAEDALRLARRMWREGEVLAAPEVAGEPLLSGPAGRQFVAATGARSVLAAPVGGTDEVVAVVTLVHVDEPGEFGPDVVAAVQSVCADLGRALEQADLWNAQRVLVDRLQDLDRQKTEFLSTVSHELRTPLTSISGYLELIRDGDVGEVPPAMDAMLDVVDRNASRLALLIEDLLTLSRIESGTFRTSTDDVDLRELVDSVAATVRPSLAEGGLDLDAVLPATALVVHGDAFQLERVLLNLASNAVKFTPRGGRVTLTARDEGPWAVLECADTGIGIPDAEQDELFSRFFRASNATARAVPGTGLGLAIVRTVVQHHGGDVDVRSVQDVGTTVTVRLPRVASAGSRRSGSRNSDVPRGVSS